MRTPCPYCGRLKPAYAIRDGRCGDDIHDEARASAQPPARTWNDIRGLRAILLQRCDWTQVADADLTTEERAAWATYRQALRDLPETYATPGEVIWPTAPE